MPRDSQSHPVTRDRRRENHAKTNSNKGTVEFNILQEYKENCTLDTITLNGMTDL